MVFKKTTANNNHSKSLNYLPLTSGCLCPYCVLKVPSIITAFLGLPFPLVYFPCFLVCVCRCVCVLVICTAFPTIFQRPDSYCLTGGVNNQFLDPASPTDLAAPRGHLLNMLTPTRLIPFFAAARRQFSAFGGVCKSDPWRSPCSAFY